MSNLPKKNKYTIYDNYCELTINSLKYGDFSVFIDLDDVALCKKHQWHMRKCYGATYDTFYVGTALDKKVTLIHRLLMKANKEIQVDHINGNKLDNRKGNLRLCTRAENSQNRKLNKDNTTGHKGVLWWHYNGVNKWMAYITFEGERKTLGYFDKFEDAVQVRLEAEEKYHKEFARDLKFQ